MSSSKKIILKSTPYIIKKKGFSTIEFVFIYSCKYSKEYIPYLPLLRQLLLNTSKKYKTEKEYRQAYDEKFIISNRVNTFVFNDNLYFEFRLVVPDPKKVKDFDMNSAFEFFIDTIYNPNIIDEEFNKECFDREKRFLQSNVKNSKKNVYEKSYQSFLNIVDDIGVLKDNIYNNIDLLEKANSKQLYNIYKDNILNNNPIIFVSGDVDKDINNFIKKYIKVNNEKIIIEKNYSNYLKPFDELKEVDEVSSDHESVLYIAYKVKNMTEEDELYLGIIKNILGHGSNDLIFKELRMNKKLIYSSNTWMRKRAGLLVIESYINNTSKEKVVTSVKSVIKKLKDEEILLSYMEKLISDLEFNLIRSKDSRVKDLNDFIDEKLGIGYSLETVLEMYKNDFDMKKLLNLLDRLTLDTIYFLRGEFNEEK
ncbi:MAG: insulinase family protein [Bacilli bacterium]|nr:insulinase family protein [Bacilli bacterium]